MKEWDVDREFQNWARRQVNKRQIRFENDMPTVSQLGFKDIDELTEAVLDRMSGKAGPNNPHRPNLLDENAT